jgi:hypothetical protein
MGVIAPVSVDTLKRQRATLIEDTDRLWRMYLGRFPMLPPRRNDAKYVVSTDAVLWNDNSNTWVRDAQEFYVGQEIELLGYIEYVATEFNTSHTFVCIRDYTGHMEHSVVVGDMPC